MTSPIYAIGDIHGQLEMLETALHRIEVDGGPNARIVFLGDYTDRGPNSRGVIELLQQGQAEGRNWTALLGNHDRMFSMYLEDYPRTDSQLLVGFHWLHPRIGGVQTLESYGVEVAESDRTYEVHARAKAAVPQSHLDFLASLPSHHQEGKLLFVHAGIRPDIALEKQSENDKIWIRREFLDHSALHPWLVVHGHTHVPQPEHRGNRVNLDSGAGFGRPLTAAVFENGEAWVLGERGRVALLPE
ncbi:metallophosphoesterase family protein [Parasedimentitalea maritima]|uniref:Serine/threonine protein phosphatase n=1 Tax=Parasedimentitalea maritima TaxID=2578117 RepID=A0A6A4RMU6_9RHOB|nr:metallophosphoesterase family protein [Zongyanglinia marina]KAE9632250.1 serine/threonine protein phosphatase [Zongyanglinia marina]